MSSLFGSVSFYNGAANTIDPYSLFSVLSSLMLRKFHKKSIKLLIYAVDCSRFAFFYFSKCSNCVSDLMDERKGRFCVIHNTERSKNDPGENLIRPQSYDSWLTLLEAAKVRRHDALLKIAGECQEGEVPEIFYHRECRSAFTLKRDLESLKRSGDLEEDDDEEVSLPTPRKRSNTTPSRVYDQECIFCEKVKYVNRVRERLVKATQLRVDHTLRQIAVTKRDKKILAITSTGM